MLAVAVAAVGACGGGETRTITVTNGQSTGPIVASGTSCRFDGDRQVTAEGIVRNPGENVYYVNVTVRFVDADGVRVDIASDSVSDLQPNESARWDAVIYSDEGDTVVGCEVATEAS